MQLIQNKTMGIPNGYKCRVHVSTVSLAGLMHMLKDTTSNNNIFNVIKVYIDFNWLHINRTNASDSMSHRVNEVMNITEAFAKCGCVYWTVYDPETRHHRKNLLFSIEKTPWRIA